MPLRISKKVLERIFHYGGRQFAGKRLTQTLIYAKRSFCHLLEQPEEYVKSWLNGFDAVISDGDGVLWMLDCAIPGAPDVMQRFQQLDKRVFICTNNSSKTRQVLWEKAHTLGYPITLDAMLCTAHATATYLQACDFQQSVYLIGSTGLASELDAVGILHNGAGPDEMCSSLEEFIAQGFSVDACVGAVIVAFDEHFNFVKLAKATTYLAKAECLFLATNMDEHSCTPTKVVPGSGSLVSAVQTAVGRKPYVIGKPNVEMCKQLIEDGVVEPARTLMIGDNCKTDVIFGRNCGFQTLLVGTGKNQPEDVHAFQRSKDPTQQYYVPDAFLPSLGDLLRFMEC